MNQKIIELKKLLVEAKLNESLSKHTFLKIGGPADLYYVAENENQLVNAYLAARHFNVPFTLLGWGSNVLVSDEGIRGLVIINKTDGIEILNSQSKSNESHSTPRWESDKSKGTFKYEFKGS